MGKKKERATVLIDIADVAVEFSIDWCHSCRLFCCSVYLDSDYCLSIERVDISISQTPFIFLLFSNTIQFITSDKGIWTRIVCFAGIYRYFSIWSQNAQ